MKHLESFKDIFTITPRNIVKLSKVMFNFLKLNFYLDRRLGDYDIKSKKDEKFFLLGGKLISIFCIGSKIIGFYDNKKNKTLMISFTYKNIDLDGMYTGMKFNHDILDFIVSKIEEYAVEKKIKTDNYQSRLYFKLEDIPKLIEEFNNPELMKEFELFSTSNKYNL